MFWMRSGSLMMAKIPFRRGLPLFCKALSSSTAEFSIRHVTLLASCNPQLSCQCLLPAPSIVQYQIRKYAKSKDRKGKEKQTKVHVSEEEMSEVINVSQMRNQFSHILDLLKEEYVKNLTLRSSAGGIENLPVELEGDKYPLFEVAQVSRKSPQMLIINASAFPQATVGIIQALRESGMNLNPQQEGTTIYVPLPKITREHRESLAKNAKMLCNKCKDQLRDVQNNYIRKVKNKDGQVSDDLIHNVQLKIQEMAHEHMQEAEKMMASKQKELLNTN